MSTPLLNPKAASRAQELRVVHEDSKARLAQRIEALRSELETCESQMQDLVATDEFFDQVVAPVVSRFEEIHGVRPGPPLEVKPR